MRIGEKGCKHFGEECDVSVFSETRDNGILLCYFFLLLFGALVYL
jgi:hypothetical protein